MWPTKFWTTITVTKSSIITEHNWVMANFCLTFSIVGKLKNFRSALGSRNRKHNHSAILSVFQLSFLDRHNMVVNLSLKRCNVPGNYLNFRNHNTAQLLVMIFFYQINVITWCKTLSKAPQFEGMPQDALPIGKCTEISSFLFHSEL